MHSFDIKRAWRPAALGLALLLATACGNDGAGIGPGSNPTGSYELQLVNEDGLPENEPMNWGTAGFQSGSLRLSEDGSWEMRIDYENVERGEALNLQDHGDYDLDGRDLLFTSDAYSDEFEGTVDGNAVAITYDFDGDGEYESHFTFVK
jgi:hypothetical protein